MSLKSKNGFVALFSGLVCILGSACNGSNTSGGTLDSVNKSSNVIGTGGTNTGGGTTTQPPSPPPPTNTSTVVGPSCVSNDSNHYCLALKYVVYTNSSGTPTVSQTQAISNINAINSVWQGCNISFEIESLDMEDPTKAGLTYNTANSSELDSIRRVFSDKDTLLVVTTGTWNRSGTLGSTGANAWTNMPGEGLYGSILEAAVGDYPNIIAHELGHYLNLDHTSNASNLMNPIIYSTSTQLSTSQCNAARSAIQTYWKNMIRT